MLTDNDWTAEFLIHASFLSLLYRYRQFAKLLSRLVRHSVQYVSDMHSLFRFVLPISLLCFLLFNNFDFTFQSERCHKRCTNVCPHSNRIRYVCIAGQQLHLFITLFGRLAIFGDFTIFGTSHFDNMEIVLHVNVWLLHRINWKCFRWYELNSLFFWNLVPMVNVRSCLFPDFQVKASQSAFLEQFNDIVVDVPAEDLYYLLQTFASMALSREINDLDFIRCVTTDLFKVHHPFWHLIEKIFHQIFCWFPFLRLVS